MCFSHSPGPRQVHLDNVGEPALSRRGVTRPRHRQPCTRTGPGRSRTVTTSRSVHRNAGSRAACRGERGRRSQVREPRRSKKAIRSSFSRAVKPAPKRSWKSMTAPRSAAGPSWRYERTRHARGTPEARPRHARGTPDVEESTGSGATGRCSESWRGTRAPRHRHPQRLRRGPARVSARCVRRTAVMSGYRTSRLRALIGHIEDTRDLVAPWVLRQCGRDMCLAHLPFDDSHRLGLRCGRLALRCGGTRVIWSRSRLPAQEQQRGREASVR